MIFIKTLILILYCLHLKDKLTTDFTSCLKLPIKSGIILQECVLYLNFKTFSASNKKARRISSTDI